MSSIVIAGDTSGSVTLQAPAVAGATILTLPATSGTVQTSGAGFTTNGVAYASSTSALATGSGLVFDGTNLGVGTSSPAKKLDILSNTSQDGIRISGSTNPRLTIIDTTTPVQFDALCTDTEVVLRTDTNHPLVLSTNGTERMRLPAAGGVQAVTTISVGNATPSSSGAGITFPATQSASSDANTLDDYEEGTWTPIDSSGAGLTFIDIVARYTKIGRVVECFAQIGYPTTANTSQATIGGLPFTNASTTGGSYGAFTVYQSHSIATTWLNSSANTISVAYTLGSGGLTNASLSTHNIRLVWIYEV